MRLAQGDPQRQTIYEPDPGQAAASWLDAGAAWLHVVDLDAAFGQAPGANQQAVAEILQTSAAVQFGGGVRSIDDVEQALSLGVGRVILGTAAAESPSLVGEAVSQFGAERVGVAIDVRNGHVQVRGWTQDSGMETEALAKQLSQVGVQIVVHTDIGRDGLGRGLNTEASSRIAEAAGLQVIASGGVASLEDVRRARREGLRGVIIGRALYEGKISLSEALRC